MTALTTSKYELMQGDCLQLLSSIPDASINMVLCDLPYGCTENKWDRTLPLPDLWKEYKRVCKPGGIVALFAKQQFTFELGMSLPSAFKYKIVWQKTQGTDFFNAKRKPLSCHEDILLFCPNPAKGSMTTYNPQMREGFEPYIKKKQGTPSSNYKLQPVKTDVQLGGAVYNYQKAQKPPSIT